MSNRKLSTVVSSALAGASGYSGAAGHSGHSGHSGHGGHSGYSGSSGHGGHSGQSGASGTAGIIGVDGASGYSGLSGHSGVSGLSGVAGATGATGSAGEPGISGFSGAAGATGTSGFSGNSGTSGSAGATGASGASGTSGAVGPAGTSGYSGTAPGNVLTTSNYNSYAPTLTGGSASGTWGISISGSLTGTQINLGYAVSGGNIDYGGQGGCQILSQGGGAAMISFHRPGAYAINFGLGTDNQLRTGGWSRGGNYVVLDSGNFGSYAVPLSGGTMSGNLFINNTSPTIYLQDSDNRSAMIHCNSNIFYILRGSGTNSTSWASTGANWPMQLNLENNDATFGGNVTAYSDERQKKDWTALSANFVEKLASVKSGTYTRTDLGTRQAGVSAQSIRSLLPEAVIEDKDGNLSLAYGNAALVSCVELAKEVLTLKEEMQNLKKQITELVGRINKLEKIN